MLSKLGDNQSHSLACQSCPYVFCVTNVTLMTYSQLATYVSYDPSYHLLYVLCDKLGSNNIYCP